MRYSMNCGYGGNCDIYSFVNYCDEYAKVEKIVGNAINCNIPNCNICSFRNICDCPDDKFDKIMEEDDDDY